MTINNIIFVGLAGVILSSCSGNVQDRLGLRRDAPDEFKVVSAPPLNIPPDFALLPPGESDAPSLNVTEQARQVIFTPVSNDIDLGKLSPSAGESKLLSKAGVSNPDIRTLLKQEQYQVTQQKEEKGMFKKFVEYASFSKSEKEPVVNASKEKERIVKNKQEGKPANDGETQTVEKGGEGLLNRVFGF